MICVEIAPNHNAFSSRHCSANYVMNVCQQLSNSDFTFLNIFCGLCFSITVSNQIAL